MEDEIMMISVAKKDYAINKEVLRAVLNGYPIDLSNPCRIHKDNEMFGYEMIRNSKDFKRARDFRKEHSISDKPQSPSGGSEDDYYEQNQSGYGSNS